MFRHHDDRQFDRFCNECTQMCNQNDDYEVYIGGFYETGRPILAGNGRYKR